MNPSEKNQQHYWRMKFSQKEAANQDTVSINGFILARGTQAIREAVRCLVGPAKDLVILDAGCGDGSVSAPLTKHNRVIGLDVIPGMLARARKKGIEPICGSFEQPPFPAGQFDLVLSVEAISLTGDPIYTLETLANLVKPGGRIITSCVNKASMLRQIAEGVLDVLGQTYPNAITLAAAANRIQKKGFDIEKTRAIVSLPGWAKEISPSRLDSPMLRVANNVLLSARKSSP